MANNKEVNTCDHKNKQSNLTTKLFESTRHLNSWLLDSNSKLIPQKEVASNKVNKCERFIICPFPHPQEYLLLTEPKKQQTIHTVVKQVDTNRKQKQISKVQTDNKIKFVFNHEVNSERTLQQYRELYTYSRTRLNKINQKNIATALSPMASHIRDRDTVKCFSEPLVNRTESTTSRKKVRHSRDVEISGLENKELSITEHPNRKSYCKTSKFKDVYTGSVNKDEQDDSPKTLNTQNMASQTVEWRQEYSAVKETQYGHYPIPLSNNLQSQSTNTEMQETMIDLESEKKLDINFGRPIQTIIVDLYKQYKKEEASKYSKIKSDICMKNMQNVKETWHGQECLPPSQKINPSPKKDNIQQKRHKMQVTSRQCNKTTYKMKPPSCFILQNKTSKSLLNEKSYSNTNSSKGKLGLNSEQCEPITNLPTLKDNILVKQYINSEIVPLKMSNELHQMSQYESKKKQIHKEVCGKQHKPKERWLKHEKITKEACTTENVTLSSDLMDFPLDVISLSTLHISKKHGKNDSSKMENHNEYKEIHMSPTKDSDYIMVKSLTCPPHIKK